MTTTFHFRYYFFVLSHVFFKKEHEFHLSFMKKTHNKFASNVYVDFQ
jgi:hypothetical protein